MGSWTYKNGRGVWSRGGEEADVTGRIAVAASFTILSRVRRRGVDPCAGSG